MRISFPPVNQAQLEVRFLFRTLGRLRILPRYSGKDPGMWQRYDAVVVNQRGFKWLTAGTEIAYRWEEFNTSEGLASG